MRELFRRQPKFTARSQDGDGPGIPDDLWVKCPGCDELIYSKEFQRLLKVCPRCQHHFRMTSAERIETLTDPSSFVEWDAGLTAADPLDFVANGESYQVKVTKAAKKSGVREALITGRATLSGCEIALAVTEFGFLGASMGSVFGEKLVRAVERALERRLPLVTVSSSGGARMHESPFSLMQMAKTTGALARLGGARLPHIAVLTDPCYGGIPASYATVADVIVAEPRAMIGFAGPRVIEQITRQKLPEGFQTAEFLLSHGMIDLIAQRRDLSSTISSLLSHYSAVPDSTTQYQAGTVAGVSVDGKGAENA
jgi:acetyl-CoA carboxylase carboxyl transferase subunit beta